MSPTEETFLINSVKIISSGKINRNSCEVKVTLNLTSNLPRPVLSNSVQMAILPCDHQSSVMGFSTGGAFVTTVGGGGGGASSTNISSNKSSSSSSNNKLIHPNKKRGSSDNKTKQSDAATTNNNLGDNNILSGSNSEIVGVDSKQRLVRKESTTPVMTCEDEDVALALLEYNPALLKLDFSLERKQDKTIQAGKLMCHDTHQSLR